MQRHIWRLVAQEEAIVRYCQGCGGKAEFRNSGKIRRNANGKRIHQFEIYKCSKDHTWNRPVPPTGPDAEPAPGAGESRLEELLLTEETLWEGLEILLERVEGRWRLDKVLAQQIRGTTRASVAAMIRSGMILLNGAGTEGKQLLKSHDRITVRCVAAGLQESSA